MRRYLYALLVMIVLMSCAGKTSYLIKGRSGILSMAARSTFYTWMPTKSLYLSTLRCAETTLLFFAALQIRHGWRLWP